MSSPLSPSDVREFFRMLDSTSVRPRRMFMALQDAMDLGYFIPCPRCGGAISPEPGYVHPLDECDASLVHVIIDS